MNIQRAQQLTKSYMMNLVQGPNYVFELYFKGQYIGELYPAQIAEMEEQDFIDYYLDAGVSPDNGFNQEMDYYDMRH